MYESCIKEIMVSRAGKRHTDFEGFVEDSDDPDPDFIAPTGLACDWRGNVFVADTGAGRVKVLTPDLRYVVTASGVVRAVDDGCDGQHQRWIRSPLGPDRTAS